MKSRTDQSILEELSITIRLWSIYLKSILQYFEHVMRCLSKPINMGDIPNKEAEDAPLRWSEKVNK